MAAWPAPVPGLVIRYAYLWKREADAGQVEGRKRRPCAIVVCVEDQDGERVVTVAPITRARPKNPQQAIELTAATRRRLGLGKDPSWIMATEVNAFCWPGPDLVPTQAGEFAYGELPAVVFRELVKKILSSGVPEVQREE